MGNMASKTTFDHWIVVNSSREMSILGSWLFELCDFLWNLVHGLIGVSSFTQIRVCYVPLLSNYSPALETFAYPTYSAYSSYLAYFVYFTYFACFAYFAFSAYYASFAHSEFNCGFISGPNLPHTNWWRIRFYVCQVVESFFICNWDRCNQESS